MTYILIVEDDNDINQLLCRIIRSIGYNAQSAYSGTEALLYLEKQKWDLVLLDLMLPGMKGKEVLNIIREQGETPVIVISAKSDQPSKVEMLRSGADDYITKPFDIAEVEARIETVLRRYKQRIPLTKRKLTHKDLTMDLDAKTVTVKGEEILLTAREFNILKLLLSEPNKIFSKANLFESVWNEPYYGDDNTVNVHISNLRNKLAKANSNEEYIETIWGMGYRMKS